MTMLIKVASVVRTLIGERQYRFLKKVTIYFFVKEVRKIIIKNTVNPSKRTVVIYRVGPGYSENLGDIRNRLLDKGYNAPIIAGHSPDEAAEIFRALRKKLQVDACICLGAIENMPKDTKIIHFVHDIHDSAISNLDKVLRILPNMPKKIKR